MSAVKRADDYFPKSLTELNQSAFDFLFDFYSVKHDELRLIMAVALSLLIHSVSFFYFQEIPMQSYVLEVEPKRMALRMYFPQAPTKTTSKQPVQITNPKPKSVVDSSEKSVHPVNRKMVIQKKPNYQNKVIALKAQHTVQSQKAESKLVAAKKPQSEVAPVVHRQTTNNKIKPNHKVSIGSTSSAIQAQSKPKIIMNPRFRYPPSPPVYPRQSIRRNQQGTTLIRAKVSRYGRVEKMKIYQSSGFAMLDQAAMAAVKKWDFEPAKQNSLAVSSWVQVPVNFVLEKR